MGNPEPSQPAENNTDSNNLLDMGIDLMGNSTDQANTQNSNSNDLLGGSLVD